MRHELIIVLTSGIIFICILTRAAIPPAMSKRRKILFVSLIVLLLIALISSTRHKVIFHALYFVIISALCFSLFIDALCKYYDRSSLMDMRSLPATKYHHAIIIIVLTILAMIVLKLIMTGILHDK